MSITFIVINLRHFPISQLYFRLILYLEVFSSCFLTRIQTEYFWIVGGRSSRMNFNFSSSWNRNGASSTRARTTDHWVCWYQISYLSLLFYARYSSLSLACSSFSLFNALRTTRSLLSVTSDLGYSNSKKCFSRRQSDVTIYLIFCPDHSGGHCSCHRVWQWN